MSNKQSSRHQPVVSATSSGAQLLNQLRASESRIGAPSTSSANVHVHTSQPSGSHSGYPSENGYSASSHTAAHVQHQPQLQYGPPLGAVPSMYVGMAPVSAPSQAAAAANEAFQNAPTGAGVQQDSPFSLQMLQEHFQNLRMQHDDLFRRQQQATTQEEHDALQPYLHRIRYAMNTVLFNAFTAQGYDTHTAWRYAGSTVEQHLHQLINEDDDNEDQAGSTQQDQDGAGEEGAASSIVDERDPVHVTIASLSLNAAEDKSQPGVVGGERWARPPGIDYSVASQMASASSQAQAAASMMLPPGLHIMSNRGSQDFGASGDTPNMLQRQELQGAPGVAVTTESHGRHVSGADQGADPSARHDTVKPAEPVIPRSLVCSVGGRTFKIHENTLERFPNCLLWKAFEADKDRAINSSAESADDATAESPDQDGGQSNKSDFARDEDGVVFFDRDPFYFEVLLGFLRTSKTHLPPSFRLETLRSEAAYFGLPEALSTDALAPTSKGRFVGFRRRFDLHLKSSPSGLPMTKASTSFTFEGCVHDGVLIESWSGTGRLFLRDMQHPGKDKCILDSSKDDPHAQVVVLAPKTSQSLKTPKTFVVYVVPLENAEIDPADLSIGLTKVSYYLVGDEADIKWS